jgi:four helix bundle protein
MAFKNYEDWVAELPDLVKSDPLWELMTYRKALFLADLAWFDCEKLLADPRGRGMAWQLVDSAGSVSANIEEGYGRGFGRDYGRFLRIALGSAREAKGWYIRGRHALAMAVVEHRVALIDELIKNLVILANQQGRKR